MPANTYSYALIGLDCYIVTIEVDIQNGLPLTHIVGLPDNIIKESKERVRSAIKNSGHKYPAKRITINLSPARTKKAGAAFDLAIAMGILAASEQISDQKMDQFAWLGELSLNGSVQPVKGCLPIALGLNLKRFKGLAVPQANTQEAALCQTAPCYPIPDLTTAIQWVNSERTINTIQPTSTLLNSINEIPDHDFCDVKGQTHAKRGLEVAAAGGHNVLMIGPPGSGKSMLAKRFQGILPQMSQKETLETTKIYSIMGMLKEQEFIMNDRPFRQPHHTTSATALVGGGSNPKPGEITLSHNGVLFLDELPEFNRHALESLRQPLENQSVTIARAAQTLTFPSKFTLLCAMNPCPCGHHSNPSKSCTCSVHQIQKYLAKISGPLLDRIDIHLDVPALSVNEMLSTQTSESSKSIKSRTIYARNIQHSRFQNTSHQTNAQMNQAQIKSFCTLDDECRELVNNAVHQLGLSARAHDKILKIARTIADLDKKSQIESHHIAEAIHYRSLDRNWWG